MKNALLNTVKFVWTLASSELLMFLGSLLGLIIFIPARFTNDSALIFASEYASFIGIWIVVLLYCFVFKKNRKYIPLLTKGMKGNNVKTALTVGLSCGILLNLISAFVAMLHGDIHLSFNEFNPLLVLLFIVSVMIQSGAEELVCRWFVLNRLKDQFPKYPFIAVIVNALFFSLGHLGNPGVTKLALVDIFLSGLMFSLIIYFFDSFWAAVVAHASWNFCQSILLGLPNSGLVSAYSIFKLDASTARDSFAYSVNFGIEGTVLSIIVLAAVCVILVVVGRKRMANSACPCEQIVTDET